VKVLEMSQNDLDMQFVKTLNRPSIQGAAKVAKRERTFELSLPALVNGVNAFGREFEEGTQLLSISAQEASFHLDARVMLGAKVNLSLEIPKTLVLQNQLQLTLSGTIVYVRAENGKEKPQFVSVRLDKNYRLQSFRPNVF
jgi:hypothetical protein